jgi:hypothetical protein
MAGGGMGGTNSSISGTSSAFGSPGGMRGFQGEMAQPAVMPSNQPSQTYLQQPPSQTSPPMPNLMHVMPQPAVRPMLDPSQTSPSMQNMMQRQPMQQFFNPFNPYGGMGGSFNPYTNQMQQPFNPYGGMGGGFNPYATNPYASPMQQSNQGFGQMATLASLLRGFGGFR